MVSTIDFIVLIAGVISFDSTGGLLDTDDNCWFKGFMFGISGEVGGVGIFV